MMVTAILLAGCGSSAGAPAANTRPQSTATSAAPGSTPTDPASIDRTATAVESLASTAVADLEAKAAAGAKPAPPAGEGAAISTTVALPPTVRPVPAPTVRSTSTSVAAPRTPPVRRPALQVAALAACCSAAQFPLRGEAHSPEFAAAGAWSLRWAARCAEPSHGATPRITIGIVPTGTNRPVDVLQMPLSRTEVVRGERSEPLAGSYMLDVISPCETWLVEAVTKLTPRAPAAVAAQAQARVLAIARAGHGLGILVAARTQLSASRAGTAGVAAGPSKRPTARATSVAVVQMRIRRVASLRSLLAQVRLQFQTLSGAEVAVNPADADFNPQGLNAVTVTLNSTGVQMTSMMATLATQSVAAPFGHPVRRLLAAIRRLQEAATGLETSIADVQAGRSGAAATDLARVGVSMHRANNALHSAQVLLAGICGSTC